MLAVAVGYQVYLISKDPLDLGLVGLAQFVPFALLTIPAGQLADLVNRRRLLTVSYFALSLCAAALAWIAVNRPESTFQIIAVVAVYGGARAVTLPAGIAIVPNLVPTSALPNAVALNSTSSQVATIAGPALGGLLLVLGAEAVYFVSAGLLILATLMLTRIKGSGIATSPTRSSLSRDALLSGFRFVRSEPIVWSSISLDMVAVLVGSVFALLPIYATDILEVGPRGLGLMRSAPAVGAVVCAVILGIRPLKRRVGFWLLTSVIVYGLVTIGFALSRNFALSLLFLAILGSADMVSVYVRNLVVHLKSPDAIRGRVSAVTSVFVGAANELGDFESGATAAWWGPTLAAAVGGVLTVGLALTWAIVYPVLRRLDRLPEPAP